MAPPKLSKRTFLRSGEGSLTSYDWVDISDGTGYVKFYGYNSISSTGTTYHLTREIIYSAEVSNLATSKEFSLAPFNTPKLVRGTAFVNFSCSPSAITTGGDFYYIVTIYHVRSAVATSIGSVQTATQATTGVALDYRFCLNIPLTATTFKPGDYLKVKLDLTKVSGTYDMNTGNDPANRTDSYLADSSYPSQFVAAIPFKIDL